MQFKSSILAILSGAALSAALAVNVRITTEELKQPDRPVAQRPISALGGKLRSSSNPRSTR